MKTVSMSGSLREGVGKKDAKKHRSEGRVPCVMYGGKEELHFVVEDKILSKIIFTPEAYFIKMNIDGKDHDCVIKDIQYHPVSDQVLHADFLEFDEKTYITTSIPLRLVGNAPGILKGGQVVKKFRRLTVRALPADMPESIIVDINSLDLNDTIHVRDIAQNKFKILEKDERFVIGIKSTRLAASTTTTTETEDESTEE